jgi:hypothetical protein
MSASTRSVDVAMRRWQKYTRRAASTGETFEQVEGSQKVAVAAPPPCPAGPAEIKIGLWGTTMTDILDSRIFGGGYLQLGH